MESAIDDLKDRINDTGGTDEPEEIIHQVADSRVPIYTNELLEVALSDLRLATNESEY